jgi:hypothetical protein
MATASPVRDLPDEIHALLHPDGTTPPPSRLKALGDALSRRKKEAMDYRVTAGTEDTWAMCEEAYAGVDDMNRSEHAGHRWTKPTSMNAPVETNGVTHGATELRSTAFVRLTTRYVDAGSAKVGEILLPIDDKAFSFDPTPVPELIAGIGKHTPLTHPDGSPMMRLTPKEELPQPSAAAMPPQPPPPGGQPGAPPAVPDGQPPQPPQRPLTAHDLAEEAMNTARDCAKKAETRVYDWMVESQHPREVRKVIFDAARLGVGVLKGPYPASTTRMALRRDGDTKGIVVKEEITPKESWVNPWNLFPDPACGENITDGDYIFERDYYSERQVRKLKGLPGYLSDQLDEVIELGPKKTVISNKNPNEPEHHNPYEVWFYHGTVDRADFEEVNPSAAKTVKSGVKQVYAIITMINDIVVRGSLNPLDSGKLPYHSIPWTRRPGSWVGVGISEQLEVPQRIVNAATRSLLNNGGVSSGPQIIMNREGVRPANGDWRLAPHKIWYASKETNMDDVRKTFFSFDIGNVTDQMLKIAEYGMKLAEESTNIPLITQGQSGETTPDTLGAAQLQNNNANQLLRNIGYGFDEYITEPLVQQYYEYLLLDPDVPDDEKGDIKINAHGSVALVERSIQDQTIAQMTPLAENPMFGVDPKKWFAELAKSKHLDPRRFQYSKEEQEKLEKQQPPPPPAVQVAQIKAQISQAQMQADAKRAQEEDALAREMAHLDMQAGEATDRLRNETEQLRIKMDTDRDTAYVSAQTQENQATYQHNMQLLQLKRDLAQLDYASKHALSLEQVKAKLADTAMKVRAAKEMATLDAGISLRQHHTPSADALMKPVTQLPGKSGDNKAFSQMQ